MTTQTTPILPANIQLLQGDCLQLLPDLADKSIDLIVCDPPYASTGASWDIEIHLDSMWQQLKRVIKDNGAVILFADMKYAVKLINSATIPFRYELVWHKTAPVGFLNANRMPLRSHELVLVFYKKSPAYNPQKVFGYQVYDHACNKDVDKIGTVYGASERQKEYAKNTKRKVSDGSRHPTSVQKFSNRGSELQTNQVEIIRIHPTQKPVALLEFLVQSYSNEGNTVLDFTAGSGSTAIACMNTNRKFIGFELDETYYQKACERIANHTPCPPTPRHKDDL